MENSPNSPVFADRYRFEPVGNDWDRGRSGYTHLVYDLKKERLGVIKRAEIGSKQAVEGLKNEVKALKALQGLGVPKVYETGEAIYGSKNYFYMVIEFIEGIRVEQKLDSLDISERAEILTQFFGLLAQAHQRGVVNGDVDLKHLYWRRDKRQLVVIDWGNTKLDVDPKERTKFAYDLARSAEIVFSLVTSHGHPPATGPIALPKNSALVADLPTMPVEFRDLCNWAPRTPADGIKSPYSAFELFEVSKKWLAIIKGSKPVNSSPVKGRAGLFGILLFIVIIGVFLITFKIPGFLYPTTPVPINTNTLTLTQSPLPSTPELTKTLPPTIPPTELPTQTPTAVLLPRSYSSSPPLITFDEPLVDVKFRGCWNSEAASDFVLKSPEGFYKQYDSDGKERDWWTFTVGKDRTIVQPVHADFSKCLQGQALEAIALNAWVTWIEPQRGNIPGREFGFFLENQTSQKKREYTLWVDEDETMHLRVREDDIEINDEKILIGGIQHGIANSVLYDQFLIQIFLEIDNEGSDILYLLEGSSAAVPVENIDPGSMTRIYVSKTFESIEKMGLVGRGGLTKVLIWPLAFYVKK